MTLAEVAEYIQISQKSIRRMLQKDEIPAIKIASQWRFSKSIIDDWLHSKMNTGNVLQYHEKSSINPNITKLMELEVGIVPLSRIIEPEFIIHDIQPGSKKYILEQLVKPAYSAGIINDKDIYLESLLHREKMVSTAIGNGIAFPHIRKIFENPELERPYIVMGICPDGTDFDALDGKPTLLFFLTITNSEVVHLRILAKLNRLFKHEKAVQELLLSKREFLSMIIEMEGKYGIEK